MTKWLLAGVGVCIAGWLAWYFSLNYLGYCHAGSRYLSDREKIEIGVAYLLKMYPPVVKIYEIKNGERVFVDTRTPTDPIPYAGLDDFFTKNPDCCRFSLSARENYQAPILSRLLGELAGFANVTYLVRYRDTNGEEIAEPIRLDPGVSNCGAIWFSN